MHRSVANPTIFQSILIAIWLITRVASWFFAALGVIVLCAAGVALYLAVRWRRLPVADRYEGIFALVGWLILAYVIIRANGLTIGSLFS